MKISKVEFGQNVENRSPELEGRVTFEDGRSNGTVHVRTMSTSETVHISGKILVNGVQLWFTANANTEGRDTTYLTGHRAGTWTDISPAAKKYLREQLIPTVIAQVVEHPEFVEQQKRTEIQYLGYDIDRAEREIAALEVQIEEERQKKAEAEARLKEIEAQLIVPIG